MPKLRVDRVEEQFHQPNQIIELARKRLALLAPSEISDRFIIDIEFQKTVDGLIRE